MNPEKRFFVTYGFGSNLARKFSVIKTESWRKAHDIAMEVTGGKFAFVYSEAEFEGQQERHSLVEVPLQAQISLN
jgi:hypothetical protein